MTPPVPLWRAAEREGWRRVAGMTLGEGTDLIRADWRGACACIGPPLCCRFPHEQAEALHRGAQITAKLLAAAADTPPEA